MKEQKKCVPEIRFAGFTDDWEQRKLGECFAERTERSAIGELISVTMNSGVVKASSLERKDNSSKNKENYKKVEKNDIAYNSMRMWQGASGVSEYSGILSPAYTVLIPQQGVNSIFFSYYFKLDKMLNVFQANSQGLTSDTWNLKYPVLKNILVTIPSLEEQTAIGNFFKQLDDTIALHRRNCTKFQNLKMAYFESIFSTKYIHNKDENKNTWEQRKLLDVIEGIIDFRGKTPKKLGLDWSERGYLALSALNVKNGYIDKNIETYFGDEILYQKWMGGSELTKGQVLFTTEAPMGNVAQVPDNEKYILSQRTIAFNVKSNIITDDFLAVLLRSPLVFNDLETLSSGGTAKGVSQKSLSNLVIKLPNSLMEQTAIGNFFKQLDDTIALHQRFWVNNNQFGSEYAELF